MAPALATPDLEAIELSHDHDLALQARELAELGGHQRAAGAVDGTVARAPHGDPHEVARLGRELGLLAQPALKALPLVEWERPDALVPFGEDEREDLPLGQLVAELGRDREPALRINRVRVLPPEHLRPPVPGGPVAFRHLRAQKAPSL